MRSHLPWLHKLFDVASARWLVVSFVFTCTFKDTKQRTCGNYFEVAILVKEGAGIGKNQALIRMGNEDTEEANDATETEAGGPAANPEDRNASIGRSSQEEELPTGNDIAFCSECNDGAANLRMDVLREASLISENDNERNDPICTLEQTDASRKEGTEQVASARHQEDDGDHAP